MIDYPQKLIRYPIDKQVLFSWLLLLLLIPCLSVFGRSLQAAARQWLESGLLAGIFVVTTLFLCVMAMLWAWKSCGPQVFWHLLWLVPLYVIYPLSLPIVEERLHFILFGVFGFVSLRLWRWLPGLLVCCLAAGGDELLQWFLPSRVGDWRDVGFNLLACLGGAGLAGICPQSTRSFAQRHRDAEKEAQLNQ